MKIATVVLAFLSALTGLIAAYQWYRSAIKSPQPIEQIHSYVPDEQSELSPLEQRLRDVADKNKTAAIWTAVAVVLGAVSNILGALS